MIRIKWNLYHRIWKGSRFLDGPLYFDKLERTVRKYFPFVLALLFFTGILMPIRASIVPGILALVLSIRSRWFLLLLVPLLGGLRFYLFVRSGTAGEPMRVVVPRRGMAIIKGIGIYQSRLYPGIYEVEGEIEGDSLLIRKARRVETTTSVVLKIDEFIRWRVIHPLDYYMVRALLLGLRRELPRDVREEFRRTGNFHLLAISGLHTGLLFLVFSFLLSFLIPALRWRYFIASILVGLYAWMISFPPSVLRAFLFVLVYSIARLLERRTPALNILGLAGIITLLIDPSDAFRAGFQLSYAATFGILYTFRYGGGTLLHRYVLDPLKVAISAQLYSTPILLMHFHQAYPFFFFSSLITVPLTFIVILSSVLSLALFFLPPVWAFLHICVVLLVGVVHLLSGLPLPPVNFTLSAPVVVSYLIILTAAIHLLRRWIKIRRI